VTFGVALLQVHRLALSTFVSGLLSKRSRRSRKEVYQYFL
jgi:hypothetical protein